MNVYLGTLGCRLNEAELETWARAFSDAGHRVVRSPEAANVMVLNSCAVTVEAARKSRQHVSRLHRLNPTARLVVTGCYAELEPAKVASLAGVDLVIGNRDKDDLVAQVADAFDAPGMPALATEPEGSHLYRQSRTRAFIKVQDGCRNRCTFCIVTVARGNERSRRIADIVTEVNHLSAEGYREAVLTGVHLGGYGRELGVDLAALVRAILRDTEIPRLRLSSLEPWDLPPGFFSLWEDPRLMPHLHLPLQSGCDTVLARMARRCTTAEFARLVADARDAIPNLTVTTDLIVGFPGETDAEWDATVAYVPALRFGNMHIFTYSPRDGTKAARLPGQVATADKKARSHDMHAIAAAMKRAHLHRFVGSTRTVLWEGTGESAPGGRRFTGYTDNYLRVEAIVPAEVSLENTITPTRLLRVKSVNDASSDDTDSLVGAPDGPLPRAPARSRRGSLPILQPAP